jgi:hypothetical protein
MTYRYFYHTNSKDAQLAHSHYSDPAYDGDGAVIFGAKRPGLRYEYADRLAQWDREKNDAAWDAAVAEFGKTNTARHIEAFLRHYFDSPDLRLVVIIAGMEAFSGYPWYAYGFVIADEVEA